MIFVGDTHGQTVSAVIQNLDVPGGDGFGGTSYPLSEGANKITARNKGLMYILYHTPDYETAQPVKIHIASGQVNGYFDVAKHQASDWNKLLSNAVDKYFDVVGHYAHLTFPTERFRTHTPDGKALIDAYDQIVNSEMELMGLYKYNKLFKNRMYLHVMYTSYMYATSYHTAYNDGTLAELCNVDKLKTSACWGPAHEIGHCNQTRPGLKWLGTTEVTNNIMSEYIQTTIFGQPSRLQTEDMGDGVVTVIPRPGPRSLRQVRHMEILEVTAMFSVNSFLSGNWNSISVKYSDGHLFSNLTKEDSIRMCTSISGRTII